MTYAVTAPPEGLLTRRRLFYFDHTLLTDVLNMSSWDAPYVNFPKFRNLEGAKALTAHFDYRYNSWVLEFVHPDWPQIPNGVFIEPEQLKLEDLVIDRRKIANPYLDESLSLLRQVCQMVPELGPAVHEDLSRLIYQINVFRAHVLNSNGGPT